MKTDHPKKSVHGNNSTDDQTLRTFAQDSIDWIFVAKKRLSWFTEMIQVDGLAHSCFQESLGLNFEIRNAKMEMFYEYLDEKELDAMAVLLRNAQERDSTFLVKLADRGYARCAEVTQVANELATINPESLSDQQLLGFFERFIHSMLLLIPVIYTEPDLEEEILKRLHKTLPAMDEGRINEIFLILTGTSKKLTILQEQRDLLQIGAAIQARPEVVALFQDNSSPPSSASLPTDLRERLALHQREYEWINTDDLYGWPWNENDFLARLHHLIKSGDCIARLNGAIKRSHENSAKYTHLMTQLAPDEPLRHLIEVARSYSHLRTHRTEVYVRSMYRAIPLLTEIGHRIGLPDDGAVYFSRQELRDALITKSKNLSTLLLARKRGMSYIMINRKIWTYFGEATEPSGDVGSESSIKKKEEVIVTGMPANVGHAVGTVRIVRDLSELSKIQPGDILVASMTIPEFIPAMERASAFVTDEGGITCHAAIISRELGVPCVIGTKSGTRDLQEGDFVQVDAYLGRVTVLRRTLSQERAERDAEV